jgi:hypothetical protein
MSLVDPLGLETTQPVQCGTDSQGNPTFCMGTWNSAGGCDSNFVVCVTGASPITAGGGLEGMGGGLSPGDLSPCGGPRIGGCTNAAPRTISLKAGGAPSNGIGAKPNGCMVVNGRTVCPSPIDKYNFLHPGQTNYRDSNSRCSQHTTVNNKTGQVQSHIDEFNPNDYFLNHVILHVIPDVIYDITGSYLFPTGNQFCPQ